MHAPEPHQLAGRLEALDPLGDDVEAKAAGQQDRRLDDRLVAVALPEIGDELAVDLQDVDGEPLELAESAVAGPEVVQRNSHSHLPDGVQRVDHAIDLAEQRALRHLQTQIAPSKSVMGEHPAHHGGDVRGHQLYRRDVDPHHEVQRAEPATPVRQLATRLVEDPLPDLRDPPGRLLGNRDEGAWRDHAERRVVPADQRLKGAQPPVPQVDLRQVVGLERPGGHGVGQVPVDLVPDLACHQHGLGEDHHLARALSLGLEQRDVGSVHQVLGSDLARPTDGETGRHGDRDDDAVEVKRLPGHRIHS